jgi:hypothetical protein
MATASSISAAGRDNAYDSVAASATDSVLVAAVVKKIRVHSIILNQGIRPLRSRSTRRAPARAPVFPALKAAANGGFVIPDNDQGLV